MIICNSPQNLGGIITQMITLIISYVCFVYLVELALKLLFVHGGAGDKTLKPLARGQ